MNTTLLVIIGVIIISWLIAWCDEIFRTDCIEDIPDIYSTFYTMYKEDDTVGFFYKVFSMMFLFLIIYPIITVVIMFSPIKYGIVETWRFIKNWIRKYIKKDYSVEEQIERNNEQKKMEEWRDSRIKGFHYEGKAPFLFDRNTYLYLESVHNESLNQCVERNLDKINEDSVNMGSALSIFPIGNRIVAVFIWQISPKKGKCR